MTARRDGRDRTPVMQLVTSTAPSPTDFEKLPTYLLPPWSPIFNPNLSCLFYPAILEKQQDGVQGGGEERKWGAYQQPGIAIKKCLAGEKKGQMCALRCCSFWRCSVTVIWMDWPEEPDVVMGLELEVLLSGGEIWLLLVGGDSRRWWWMVAGRWGFGGDARMGIRRRVFI